MGRPRGQEAVPVVPLVGAGAPFDRRVELRPRDQALEQGEALEHPAGFGILRKDRVLDAEAAQEVADLQPPGTASKHDGLVPAGRMRSLGYPGHLTAVLKRLAS